jgi:predicted RNA-binding Zn-ribbon protein involved in translation (DUF1610 family)
MQAPVDMQCTNCTEITMVALPRTEDAAAFWCPTCGALFSWEHTPRKAATYTAETYTTKWTMPLRVSAVSVAQSVAKASAPVSSAARAGADLLDARNPRWYHLIDLEQLDTTDGYKCVLGQLYRTYYQGLEALKLKTADSPRYGFSAATPTDAWRELIQARRIAYLQTAE